MVFEEDYQVSSLFKKLFLYAISCNHEILMVQRFNRG